MRHYLKPLFFGLFASLLNPSAHAAQAPARVSSPGAASANLPMADSKSASKLQEPVKEGKVLNLEEVRAIQGKLSTNSFLSLHFTQTVYKSLRNKTSTNSGKAFFSKPNRFRWVLEVPNHDEWIFDGKDLLHYQPKQKQATRYGAAAAQGKELRQIVDMVMNFDSLLSQYDLKEAKQVDDRLELKLDPKKKASGSDITTAELTLDLKSNFISGVKLHFGKNYNYFAFSQPQNKALESSLFTAPQGVKVTDAI